MTFEAFLNRRPFLLTEGSIYERLRRQPAVTYDPHLAHSSLVYDEAAATVLAQVHREYLEVGQRYQLPMIALTDTWRASKERIARSAFRDRAVNQDNAAFLCALCEAYRTASTPVFVGGLTACRGDAYRPEEALSRHEAAAFHAYQIQALAATDIDFLLASTLPAFSEAHGIAAAMATTTLPYVLSFVIRREGTLLDGTPLVSAIEEIDATVARPPVGYFVNCVHPTVLRAALTADDSAPARHRIIGFQANTSARSPEALDGMETLETEKPSVFAAAMMTVYTQFHISILGGCCGTDTRHITGLAQAYRASVST